MSVEKHPITTHVLNTITGRPAENIHVSLTIREPKDYQSSCFLGDTNADGRILKWKTGDRVDIEAIYHEAKEGRLLWELSYDVEGFYGQGKTLFRYVTLEVYQDVDKHGHVGHLHVPLLLGPYNYTTYRGS